MLLLQYCLETDREFILVYTVLYIQYFQVKVFILFSILSIPSAPHGPFYFVSIGGDQMSSMKPGRGAQPGSSRGVAYPGVNEALVHETPGHGNFLGGVGREQKILLPMGSLNLERNYGRTNSNMMNHERVHSIFNSFNSQCAARTFLFCLNWWRSNVLHAAWPGRPARIFPSPVMRTIS